MAENVGTIYFTVEADTAKLLDAVKPAEKSLDDLNSAFQKTDKEAKGASDAIGKTGKNLSDLGSSSKTAAAQVDGLGRSTGKVGRNFSDMSAVVNSTVSNVQRVEHVASRSQLQLTKTAEAVQNLGREANSATSPLGALSKVLGGLLTLQGVNSLIQMAEGYNEMAERVRMASGSAAEYEMVQQRLLATANGTYRSLAEAQEIYIRTADSLRTMGYSASESLDITDSLSYAFVRSATSADRAQIAMGAFSRSLSKGRVDSDAWEMLLISIPTLAQDVATALGKTSEEIRKMGAEGKLTTDQLAEGFLKTRDVNKAASDGMATTVRDAYVSMKNNLAAYVGEANQAAGATNIMSAAVVGLGQNIDTIVKTLMTAGAGALALYIARTGAAALESMKAMMAARVEAAENLRLAQARAVATQAALAHAQANAGLTGTFSALTAAQNANNAATVALAATQRAAASAGATLLGVLGGPVGIIALVASAAAGMYLFSDSANVARMDLSKMGDTLEDVKKKIAELTDSNRRLAEQSAQLDLDAAVRKLDDAYDDLVRGSLADGTRAVAKWRAESSQAIADVIDAAKRGEISYRELDAALLTMVESYAEVNGRSREWISQMTEQIAATAKTALEAENARQKLDLVAEANRQVAAAARDAAAGTRELNNAFKDSVSDDYLKRLKEQTNALRDGNSELKKAQRYITEQKEAGNIFSPEREKEILAEATAHDKLKSARTSSAAVGKAANKEANEAKRAAEANIETLDRLGQALYFAGLQGEALALAQARASLNQFATPDQVEQVEAMARALFNIQQIEQQRQKFGTGQQADQYIMGNVQPLSGGAFDDQYARYEAEAEAEQKRYDDQLERLRQARELKAETNKSYDQLEEEMAREHSKRMQQIEQAKAQALLSSGENLFGALADAAKNYAGESSGAYKAMFAASKAFAIANATLNLSTAISQAMADPTALTPAQKFANMAAIASAGGQLVSAISGASFGGGRQYGGPVAAGKMYRINETGAPEILNTNGKQYLMMNQSSGRVTPMESGGAGGHGGAVGGGQPIQINIEVNVSGDGGSQTQVSGTGPQQAQQFAGLIAGQVRQVVIEELGQGGLLWNQRHGYS